MPGLQIVDLSPKPHEKTTLENTLQAFSNRYRENQVQEQEADELTNIYADFQNTDDNLDRIYRELQTNPGISPTARVEQTKNIMELKKRNAEQAKAYKDSMSPEEYDQRISDLEDQGLTHNEAREYIRSAPGVQQAKMRQVNEEIARGIRNRKPVKKAAAANTNIPETPGGPPQNAIGSEDSYSNESQFLDENAWPEIPPPSETTPAEKEKNRSQNQRENNKVLQDIRKKNEASRNIASRLNVMQQLNERIPDDNISRLVINPLTGEPYGAAQLAGLVSPELQQYVKTVNDFLVDAKNYFGGRVTNFEIGAFKSRLASLLNTQEGRRVIIKQMQLMNDLENIHNKTMQKGLQHYGRNANYSDITSVVDDKVAAQEEDIIFKINNLVSASEYLNDIATDPNMKDRVLMTTPDGNFKAVRRDEMNKAYKKQYKVF